MRRLLSYTLLLTLAAGACNPKPQAQEFVAFDPGMRPLELLPDWEQFAAKSFGSAVVPLVEPAQSVDFGEGPQAITANYLPDVGTLLTATGPVLYVDDRGTLMQARCFVRWFYPGLTTASNTPWEVRSAGVIDRRPVPLPETQPADPKPADDAKPADANPSDTPSQPREPSGQEN